MQSTGGIASYRRPGRHLSEVNGLHEFIVVLQYLHLFSSHLCPGTQATHQLLARLFLIAFLSGQSQVALPPTQPTPAYFNTANITSVSSSAILLNCPTAPIFPTVLTDDALGINTTNRATNNSASIGAASSIGPNVTHPVPNLSLVSCENTVPCTLAPAPPQ
ncbi:hypothetical protein FGIG_12261 [Fasciola gigantica]|uniref:Uncharacterized protein n=1 Tax=Fasciola gigantica TaxID=46835 RepID=A0A504YYI3_FASGI|nr:hypothetical protein FGIG_12261 [Fasciola gigantica]